MFRAKNKSTNLVAIANRVTQDCFAGPEIAHELGRVPLKWDTTINARRPLLATMKRPTWTIVDVAVWHVDSLDGLPLAYPKAVAEEIGPDNRLQTCC